MMTNEQSLAALRLLRLFYVMWTTARSPQEWAKFADKVKAFVDHTVAE